MTTFEEKQAEISRTIKEVNDKIIELSKLEAKMTKKDKLIEALTENDEAMLNELVNSVETYRPMISKLTDLIISFGPELKKVISPLAIGLTDLAIESKARSVKQLMAKGFEKDDAITLTIDAMSDIARACRNINTKK